MGAQARDLQRSSRLRGGSFVARVATDIGWVIVGRCLQGPGAISAAVIALTADLTRDVVRTRAMAAIGITIAATFAVVVDRGRRAQGLIGVPGIFALTGVLALAAIAVVAYAVPLRRRGQRLAGSTRPLCTSRRDPQLLRLNYGTFACTPS
jgi:predicted MFS family arabinose efflux permease